MSPSDYLSVPASLGRNWLLARIRQLEMDLRHTREQLSAMSLSNAHQMMTISEVYNIASMREDDFTSIQAIKEVIRQNIKRWRVSSTSSSVLSSDAGDSVTPPSTCPETRHSSDYETTGSGEKTSSHSSVSGDARPLWTETVPDAATTMMNASRAAGPVFTTQVMTAVKNMEVNPNSDTFAKDVKNEGSDDVDDETWQEFSLEEELEGIADAPATCRRAMRAALCEKEKERSRQIRDSADDKRRIAEYECFLLKQKFRHSTSSKPPAEHAAQGRSTAKQNTYNFEYNSNGSYNLNSNGVDSSHCHNITGFSGNIPGGSDVGDSDALSCRGTRNRTGGQFSRTPSRTTIAKIDATIQLSETVALDFSIDESDSDANGDAGSSLIINIEAEPPKLAERYGIVYDPYKLNETSTMAIGGARCKTSTNLRTLLIQNIPPEFSLHNLLAHVRGGSVVLARLVPKAVNAGYGQVAMITFKSAEEASTSQKLTAALLSRTESNTAQFDPKCRMSVSLLPTPTYPTRDVFSPLAKAHGFNSVPLDVKTRSIYVVGFPKQHIHELCTELLFTSNQFPSKIHTVEEMWFEGGTLHMLFISIQEAESAYNVISIFHFRKYSGHVHYGPDPCSKPVVDTDKVFAGGTIKAASHGYMGLKSLLETVSLASFSRCHGEASADADPNRHTSLLGLTKMSFSALLSQTKTLQTQAPRSLQQPILYGQTGTAYSKSLGLLKEGSFKATVYDSWSNVTSSEQDGSWSPAPWTTDQMVGLDLFQSG